MEQLLEHRNKRAYKSPFKTAEVDLDQPILIDLIIEPNQSLSHPAFIAVMLILGLITLGLSIFFLYLGAWPVLGFLGLDLALLFLAFKLNARSLKIVERVCMNDREVMVARESAQCKECWIFDSYWLNISIKNGPRGKGYIQLSSHGFSIHIGAFLTIPERQELVKKLRASLVESRSSR